MADLQFPLSFLRQFAGPLDRDLVFATLAEMGAYLASPRRYPGQVVFCLEDQALYALAADGLSWLAAGGPSEPPVEPPPGGGAVGLFDREVSPGSRLGASAALHYELELLVLDCRHRFDDGPPSMGIYFKGRL